MGAPRASQTLSARDAATEARECSSASRRRRDACGAVARRRQSLNMRERERLRTARRASGEAGGIGRERCAAASARHGVLGLDDLPVVVRVPGRRAGGRVVVGVVVKPLGVVISRSTSVTRCRAACGWVGVGGAAQVPSRRRKMREAILSRRERRAHLSLWHFGRWSVSHQGEAHGRSPRRTRRRRRAPRGRRKRRPRTARAAERGLGRSAL